MTGYFSRNLSEEDLAFVQRFFTQSKDISVLNSRAWKNAEGEVVVSIASIEKKQEKREFEGKTVHVEWGEFAFYLQNLVKNLERALPFAANDN